MPIDAPVFDFSVTSLATSYPPGTYLKIIDNVFTPAECAALVALAESDAQWAQAAVHYGLKPNENYINTEYRNSERILRFDEREARKIYERLLPYIQELVHIGMGSDWEGVVARKGMTFGDYHLVGLNERLSFLRYGRGNYFRGHCDGQLELPDGRKSRVTLQIYLGGEDIVHPDAPNTGEELRGGTTRIWGSNQKAWMDVEPKPGRVLIFQQRGLWHSGEEVESGVKYALRSDFMFEKDEDDDEVDEYDDDEDELE